MRPDMLLSVDFEPDNGYIIWQVGGYVKLSFWGMQGNRLRTERKITNDREGIIEGPGTTLTLASKRIFNTILKLNQR